MRRPGSRYTSPTCTQEGSIFLALETGLDNVSQFVWLYASRSSSRSTSGTAQNEFKQTIPLDKLSCVVCRELCIAITAHRASPKWTHKPSWARLAEGNSVRQIDTNFNHQTKG